MGRATASTRLEEEELQLVPDFRGKSYSKYQTLRGRATARTRL
jgi:hypothetical protein